MLAQSTNNAPSAATHDPGGVSPASALLKGAGGKKTRGIAGLFAEILSKAQKNLGSKGGEEIKLSASEPRPSSEASKGIHKKISAFETRSEKLRDIAHQSKAKTSALAASASPDHASAASRGLHDLGENEALAKARTAAGTAMGDRREKSRAGGTSDQEAVAAPAPNDKRRVGDKRLQASEGATAGASANAMTLANAMNSSRAKAPSKDVDGDSSIEKKAERSSQPKVSVLDLRRSAESKAATATKPDAKTDISKDSIREAKLQGSDAGREIHREFSLDTRGFGEAGGSLHAGKTDSASGHGQDFQSMMAERMRDAWNGEIVQSAHIVLKDGDSGIIRLRLKPESLGNVKIELNLSENNISGRIVVESDAAKNAFERNMNELADAFKQGGFDSATLQVSVGGGSGGGAQAGGAGAESPAGPFFSERFRDAAASSAATAVSAYSRRGGTVDILA